LRRHTGRSNSCAAQARAAPSSYGDCFLDEPAEMLLHKPLVSKPVPLSQGEPSELISQSTDRLAAVACWPGTPNAAC